MCTEPWLVSLQEKNFLQKLCSFLVWEVGSDGKRREVKRKLKKDEEFVLGDSLSEACFQIQLIARIYSSCK